jgi:hypothetical protein
VLDGRASSHAISSRCWNGRAITHQTITLAAATGNDKRAGRVARQSGHTEAKRAAAPRTAVKRLTGK